ncbi:MAG: hypothetical protein ACRYGI_12155 [Janthinobacterium lividum]
MEYNARADTVLTALFTRLRADRAEADGAPVGPAPVKRLAQEFGEQALQCVAHTLEGRHEALVQSSATMLRTLVELWVASGLTPDEIWIELHKREQLGSLLMQLNQAQSRAPRRLLKPWRVDSTKLP